MSNSVMLFQLLVRFCSSSAHQVEYCYLVIEPGSVTTPRLPLYPLSTSQPTPAHLQARQLKAAQRQAA